jgi:TetR/AcrR family transcriptional repressor of nem operon
MNRSSTAMSTREKLLDQGVAMITEHGYHGVGLQSILQSVGVPKGSFYHYFASKEDFSAEVIQHYIAPFIEQLDHELQRPDIDARQALRAYFRDLTEEAARRDFHGGCLLGNLMGEIGETSEKCRKSLHAAVNRYRDKFADGLRRGQREGVFRADLSAESMADLLVNQWQGALLRMKIERSVRPLEDCRDSLVDGYFAG